MMNHSDSHKAGYLLAATLGALTGGFAVLVATKALPRMFSQIMSSMMQNMMSETGCSPSEM